MNVYKNGICRKVDKSREQEFKEKGYTIEGVQKEDFKKQNEALKKENEALKQQLEQLESLLKQQSEQLGGDGNGNTIRETKAATRAGKQ